MNRCILSVGFPVISVNPPLSGKKAASVETFEIQRERKLDNRKLGCLYILKNIRVSDKMAHYFSLWGSAGGSHASRTQ